MEEQDIAIQIIDEFEELLQEKNIKIPSTDREDNDSLECEQAAIYGSEYYTLEDAITKILKNFKRRIKKEVKTK